MHGAQTVSPAIAKSAKAGIPKIHALDNLKKRGAAGASAVV